MLLLVLTLVALQAAAPVAPVAATDATYRIDPTTITLIGGLIVTIITTIVTGVISIITAVHMKAVAAQQTVNATQLVNVAKDTEAIKGHVNSEKTAATGREAALQQENRLLREMLTDKAAQLAAVTPAPPRPGRSTDPPPAPLPVEVVNTSPVPVAPVAAEASR